MRHREESGSVGIGTRSTLLGDLEVFGVHLEDGVPTATVRVGQQIDQVPLAALAARMSNLQGALAPEALPTGVRFRSLSPEKRRRVLERLQDVLDVRDGRPPFPGSDPRYSQDVSRRQRCDHKCAERGVVASTVNRWINWYDDGGIDGLVHKSFDPPSNVLDQIPPPVLALLQAHVTREKTSSRKSVENHHAMVLDDLRRAGMARGAMTTTDTSGNLLPEAWDLLNRATFDKAFRALNGNAPSAQSAKTRQSQNRRPGGHGVKHRGFDFGDVVMVDSTPVDIELYGPNGAYRPNALFAICVATRYQWVRLVPHKPTGRDLGLLIHDMINPQPFGMAPHAYQPITTIPRRMKVNAWPPQYGDTPPGVLPGIIIADHGSEEESDHHISLAGRLGTQIEWATSMGPTDKANVESSISTFAVDCQLIPGHIGNSVKNSPERRGDMRRLRFETLHKFMAAYPFWVAAKPHSGLTHPLYPGRYLTPSEAVNLSLSVGSELRYSLNPTTPIEFLPRVSLTPATTGVEFKNVVYVTAEPAEWELLVSYSHGAGRSSRARRLDFYYDPYDLTRLMWIVPDQMRAVTLYAPGGDGQVAAPLADVLHERYSDVDGLSAPTAKSRINKRSELAAWIRDVSAADLLSESSGIAPVSPRRRSPVALPQPSGLAAGMGVDTTAFDDFADIDPDEFDL